jgi:outer membrane protein, heavy metal efflux system
MPPNTCSALHTTTYGSSAVASLLIAIAATSAQVETPPSGLTEGQYVQRVLVQSLDAAVAERDAALGRAEAVGAGAWPNPLLTWNREAAPASAGGTQDIFFASIPLVLSGRLGLAEDAADQRARAAAARAESARAALHFTAVQAFHAVLIARQRCAVLEASLAEVQELTRAVEVRERAGEASGYDRVRIEVERATIATALRGAQADERRAAAEALRLLGPSTRELPLLSGSLDVERPLPGVEALLSQIEARRADIRALDLEAQAAETARRSAARSGVLEPTLSAGVQLLDLGASDPEPGYVVGLSVPLPFFDHRQGEQARSAAIRELASARRRVLLEAARARLVAAFAEVTSGRDQLARHRSEVIAKTTELCAIATAAYRGGAAELLVLLDAERANRDAWLTAIDLAGEIAQAEANLLFLAGAYDGKPREGAER